MLFWFGFLPMRCRYSLQYRYPVRNWLVCVQNSHWSQPSGFGRSFVVHCPDVVLNFHLYHWSWDQEELFRLRRLPLPTIMGSKIPFWNHSHASALNSIPKSSAYFTMCQALGRLTRNTKSYRIEHSRVGVLALTLGVLVYYTYIYRL